MRSARYATRKKKGEKNETEQSEGRERVLYPLPSAFSRRHSLAGIQESVSVISMRFPPILYERSMPIQADPSGNQHFAANAPQNGSASGVRAPRRTTTRTWPLISADSVLILPLQEETIVRGNDKLPHAPRCFIRRYRPRRGIAERCEASAIKRADKVLK